jgi:hypothetical protein
MLKPWFDLTLNAAFLGLETQRVVGLRLMKLAAGGTAAQTEAQLMVSEKVAEAAATLATGGSAHKVLQRYRTHVQANERRLTRRKRK